MCGIVGYSGKRNVCGVLMNGLERLEYRGYDSAGVAFFKDGCVNIIKDKGRIGNLGRILSEKGLISEENTEPKNCGIGHTRWATHGAPARINSHPHSHGRVTLVHNGIIENYMELREKLEKDGAVFVSETDTEAAAVLIDSLYDGDPVKTICKAEKIIEGAYAFGILFSDKPGELYAVKYYSPLIAAAGKNESFIASDISAVLDYTRDYILPDDGDIIRLSSGSIKVFTSNGIETVKPLLRAAWTTEQAQKGGYEHYMLKEINEQPKALYDTIHPRIRNGLPSFEADGLPEDFFDNAERIYIVACGSAMHAGMVGKSLIESIAGIPVETDIASEFRYREPAINKNCLFITISQSGETADTLAALRMAKKLGASTLSVINVAGSTIARESDAVIHTYAGPEIAVASTKAYSAQLSVMYLIAFAAALRKGRISEEKARILTAGLLDTVEKSKLTLKMDGELKEYTRIYKYLKDLFFVGRGLDYMLSLEGALKLKEISYVHCEAYAAGELKHGPISLITESVPVIALATQQALLPKMISNIREVRARGADVLLICREGTETDEGICSHKLTLPQVDDIYMPILCVIPLQFIAYYTAALRGCDIDKPRNLAKSVTVE